MGKAPIVDLKFLPISEACPPEYKAEKFGEWPGTKKGCYCKGKFESGSYCYLHPTSC